MRLYCPHCGKAVESGVELAVGQHVQCPYCEGKFAYGVPPPGKSAAPKNFTPLPDGMSDLPVAPAAAAEPRSSAAPAHRSGKPVPVSSPTLEQSETRGGGFGKLVGAAVLLVLLVGAVFCVPHLKTAVLKQVAPAFAARSGFEPAETGGAASARRARKGVARRDRTSAETRADADARPEPEGARLSFCDGPESLGPGAVVKRFDDGGAIYVVGDRAYFASANTNAVWTVPGVGGDFDPTVALGEAKDTVEGLSLDTSCARFRVKAGFVDTRRVEGAAKEAKPRYVRDVTWQDVADVPYGEKVPRAAFEKSVGVALRAWAKKRAIETMPLDRKLRVSVQVYDGRQVVFNEATGKWLLPRYRAQSDDKDAWDRINARLDGEQKRFVAHRREVQAKRRAWYEGQIANEHLFEALGRAVVSVEPHYAEPKPAEPEPEPAAAEAPVAAEEPKPAAAEPAVSEPAETRPAPPPDRHPAESGPAAASAAEDDDSDLVEYDDDF